MKFTKAEVEIIVLANVDIVTASKCPDLVWAEATEEAYASCQVTSFGWKNNCGPNTTKGWEHGKKN